MSYVDITEEQPTEEPIDTSHKLSLLSLKSSSVPLEVSVGLLQDTLLLTYLLWRMRDTS